MILYAGIYNDSMKKLCIMELSGDIEPVPIYTKVDLTNLSRQQVIELFMMVEEGALPPMIPYPILPSNENEFFNTGDTTIYSIEGDIEGIYILKALEDGMPMEMRAKEAFKRAKEKVIPEKEKREVKVLYYK